MPEEKLASKVKSTFTNGNGDKYDVVFFALPLIDYKAKTLLAVCEKTDEDIIDILAVCLNNGVEDFVEKLSKGLELIEKGEL